MTFLEHLEELRWHLIRSLASILVFGIGIFVNINWIFTNVIYAPFKKEFFTHEILCQLREALCFEKLPVEIIALGPYEQFLKSITISFIAGFIISFPYFIWEMWRFIKPGLKASERKGVRGNVFIISILFFIGVAFSYYVILPFAIQFLSTYQLGAEITNQWKVGLVVGMVTQITLAGGILFEMPIIVYYLSKMGILTPEFMKKYQRHAIVIMLVLAAIITPPDVVSQVLIFFPLLLLYKISIRICTWVTTKEAKKLEDI